MLRGCPGPAGELYSAGGSNVAEVDVSDLAIRMCVLEVSGLHPGCHLGPKGTIDAGPGALLGPPSECDHFTKAGCFWSAVHSGGWRSAHISL